MKHFTATPRAGCETPPRTRDHNLGAGVNSKTTRILHLTTATAMVPPVTRQPLIDDVLINEFLPNPNTGNEWIELYNTSSDILDVSGMWLDDIAGAGSSPKHIPLGTVIAPGGYYVHDMGGAYLNNGGDDVRLLNTDQSTIFDSFSYSSSQKGVSYCRQPDGGTWASTCAPSINAGN